MYTHHLARDHVTPASAQRGDFGWSNHFNSAQRITDGLPNKDPAD